MVFTALETTERLAKGEIADDVESRKVEPPDQVHGGCLGLEPLD